MLANPQGARQKAPGVTVMQPHCTSEGAELFQDYLWGVLGRAKQGRVE